MARGAPSILAMRAEADRIAPRRDRASDGIVGDRAHAARRSDHNPDARGIVHAIDLDHDPGRGWDAHARCEHLRNRAAAGLEPRLTYVISNHRIASAAHGWYWRSYGGSNAHTAHAHHSIGYTLAAENDTSPWFTDEGGLTVAEKNEIIRAIEMHALAAYLDRRKHTAALAAHNTKIVKSAIEKLGGKIDDLGADFAQADESNEDRDVRVTSEVRAELAAVQEALDALPDDDA